MASDIQRMAENAVFPYLNSQPSANESSSASPVLDMGGKGKAGNRGQAHVSPHSTS